MLSNCDRPVN